MLDFSNGENQINLGDAIAEAAELFCEIARSEGDFYNQDRVAFQIGEFVLNLLSDLDNGGLNDLINHKGGGSWNLRSKLFKSIEKLEPMSLTTAEEYQDRIAA